MKEGYGYIFHNPQTGHVYVGSAESDEVRRKQHLRLLDKGTHPNKPFQRAYNQNRNFDFVAVQLADRNEAFDFEQAVIDDHWGNPLLLNRSRDARHVHIEHSDEAKRKNRQAKQEQWQDPQWRDSVIKAQRAGHAARTEDEKLAYANARSEGLKKAYANGHRTSTAGQQRSEAFCERNSKVVSTLWSDPVYRARQMEARAKHRRKQS